MRTLVLTKVSHAQRPIDRWLQDCEALVVLTADPEWPAAGGNVEHVEVTASYNAWSVEAAASALAQRHRVERVASSSEVDVLRSARLREQLGLPGQDRRSAHAYRDKLVMKQLAHAAGVPVARFASAATPADVLEFRAQGRRPVVVKPRLGGGSQGVEVLITDDDVLRWLEQGDLDPCGSEASGWLLEDFQDGLLHHVDGLMQDGQVLHCWPSAYSSGNLDGLRNRVPLASHMLAADDPLTSELQAFTSSVVGALPRVPFPTAFHLEAFVDYGRSPVLCEIASRPGGAGVAAAYVAAFGVHLSRDSLRGQAGLPVTAPTASTPRPHCGWVLLPSRGRTFLGLDRPRPQADLILERLPAAGDVVAPAQVVTDGAGLLVLRGENASQVRHQVEALSDWWATASRWRA